MAERAKARIADFLGKLVGERGADAHTRDAAIERLRPVSDYGALEVCEFVVEAGSESAKLKLTIFETLGETRRGDPRLQHLVDLDHQARQRDAGPTARIGMHFMNPVPLMKLVEVVRGLPTSRRPFGMTVQLAERFGKTTIVLGDIPASS